MSDEFRFLGPPLGPEADGERTDLFLAKHFPFHSRSRWSTLCRDEHLLVNGRPVRPSHRLRGGDRLAVFHPLSEEPEVDDRIELVAEEAGVIAVYKPGNLPMHESGFFRRRTFGALLAARFGAEWAPVHRLDRETSGLVLCAATPETRRALSEAWAAGQVAKRYLAIVRGRCPWDGLVVDEPIALLPGAGRPRYWVDPRGAAAVTELLVQERAFAASLIEARPRTGRTNQIRVHAAWAGHALMGDKVYHPDPRVYARYSAEGDSPPARRLAGFARHALHAAGLRFRHPETGRMTEYASALPEDLARLWRQLQGAAPLPLSPRMHAPALP
jgi:23S rRNA pseudouridine1911/1915/1917 synthase